MRYLVFLAMAFSMYANAGPITWNLDEQECQYTGGSSPILCIMGSFTYDSMTDNYSDIDLTAYYNDFSVSSHTPFNDIV